MKAIVTGHTKGLGEAIAAELLARGVAVLGLARGAAPALAARFPGRLREARTDLADGAALLVTANGAEAIGDNVVLALDLRRAALDYGDNRAFVVANGLLDVYAPGDEIRPVSAQRQERRSLP